MKRFARGPLWSLAAPAVALGLCGGCSEPAEVPPFWSYGQVLVADLDRDGRADVALAATWIAGPPPRAGTLQIFLGGGEGFAAPVAYPTGPDPWGLSAGDLDGDGWLDLIAASPSSTAPVVNSVGDSGGVSVLLQDAGPTGTFLPAVWVPTGGAAEAAAVLEATGDDLADLAIADGVDVNGRALLLAQDGEDPGSFLLPATIPAGAGHGSDDLAVADVNGDGRMDLLLAGGDAVALLYQEPGGGFGSPLFLPAGRRVQGVAAADLDGDGRVDVVAANAGDAPAGGAGGSSVTVLLQTRPGAFTATSVPVPDGARRVAIADLDGDGLPDIASLSIVYQARSAPSRVSILLQSPEPRGGFALDGVYDGTFTSSFLALGDVDGDGRVEVVLNEGPSVLHQTWPGGFGPPQRLR